MEPQEISCLFPCSETQWSHVWARSSPKLGDLGEQRHPEWMGTVVALRVRITCTARGAMGASFSRAGTPVRPKGKCYLLRFPCKTLVHMWKPIWLSGDSPLSW